MFFILFFFGILTGICTLLFGFGGGFIIVPVLYSLLTLSISPDNPIHQSAMLIAVATSTCIMIPNTALATYKHISMKTLQWSYIRPILPYMALGGFIGASIALFINPGWIRWGFIIFLLFTIIDSSFRSGFLLPRTTSFTPLNHSKTATAGLSIGALAAFLGVGGSVLTVPLMRRRGATMTQAAAMANPLSLPMATIGTLTYLFLAKPTTPLGNEYLGYVNIHATYALILGSWLGIHLATPWLNTLSDKKHAITYLVLLYLVLIVMLIL